jgi:hypothetical protein
VLIRTRFRVFLLILSESSVYSDLFSRFPPNPVRIRCSFGPVFRFPTLSCPNQVLIWTGVRLWPPYPVRIKCSFGLEFSFSTSSCPNQVLIRTGVRLWPPYPVRIKCSFGLEFSFSTLSYPNQVLIRTGVRVIHQNLFETDAHPYTLFFHSYQI